MQLFTHIYQLKLIPPTGIQYGNDSDINGFHLYIGDKEEKYDIYLLRDGRYGVIKNK